jgi:two-component system sensor histidine kinase HydH
MPRPQLETVDLNALARGTMKLFEAQLGAAGITAALEFDEALPAVEADPEQMTRVLKNLVLNAVDAMPSGGRVTVRTSRRNGAVRLEVADTGQGLTPEECERLFTPYYTSKTHGTGLGLAIVQSVVSDHGGSISVESEPGRGATFRIDLPVNRAG